MAPPVDPSVFSQLAALQTYARPRVSTDERGRVSMEWATAEGIVRVTLNRIYRKGDSLGR